MPLSGFTAGGTSFFFITCGLTKTLLAASIAGLLGGLIGSALLTKIERLGIIACGAGGGLMIALYFNGFILHHLYDEVPSASDKAYVPYLVDLACMVLGGSITYCVEREIIIVSTAMSGAYFLGWGFLRLLHQVLGFNLSTKGFSPLEQFSGSGCTGTPCNISLAACIIIGVLGAFVQWHKTSKGDSAFAPTQRYDIEGMPIHVVDSHGNQREGYIVLRD